MLPPDHCFVRLATAPLLTTSQQVILVEPLALIDFLGSACNQVTNHVWRSVHRDTNVLQAHSGGLGRAPMFKCVCSVGFSEVDSLSLVDLVSLLEVRISVVILDVGSGTGKVILLTGMM